MYQRPPNQQWGQSGPQQQHQQYPPNYPQPLPPQYQGQPLQGYPQQPPPQYPQRPSKKKGHPFLVGCGILAAIVVLLVIIGTVASVGSRSSPNTGTTTDTGANTTPTQNVATAKHFKVGDAVTIGSTWKAVVSSFKANAGTAYEKPRNGTYAVVNISLTNISGSEQTLSSLLEFKFQGSDGTAYTETILTGTAPSPNGKVEAGGVTRGDLVYDVPTSVKSFTLSFEQDLLSAGQTIWDLNL